MRLLGLVVVVAACSGDEGAILTVHSAQVPGADRIEIVLAGLDTEMVSNQREKPGDLAEEAVRYYRQRATGGGVGGVSALDGFTVRIEPNPSEIADTQFIPFVLAYTGDALTGIGVVLDATMEPGPITIARGKLTDYPVELSQVGAGGDSGVAADQALVVTCANPGQAAWDSGIAWRRGSGVELRLLLPDLGADPMATDASPRLTDLDCDQHAAADDDCDDLRGAFFRGNPREVCDGLDTNCDGARAWIADCSPQTATCAGTMAPTGTQLCDDEGAGTLSACTAAPQCQCPQGTCIRCVLDYNGTADPAIQRPCAPAISDSHLPIGCSATEPCDVVVLPSLGPWDTLISTEQTAGYAKALTGVVGPIYLQISLTGTTVAGTANQDVASQYLAVTRPGGVIAKVGIDVALAATGGDTCALLDNGPSLKMTCQ